MNTGTEKKKAFNVPESQSSDRSAREAEDKASVLNIIKEIGIVRCGACKCCSFGI